MPRAAALVLPILREALPGVQVVSRMPEVSDRRYPMLLVHRAGGNAIHIDLLDRMSVNLQCWAADDDKAEQVLLNARAALWSAHRSQRVIPGVGHISYMTEVSGPNSVPSQIDGHARYQSLYSLRVRPAAS